MTVRELTAAIAKGELAPVYAVLGEEAHLRDRAVAALKAAVGGGGESGIEAFNLDLLYGDECGAADILARATEAPVFAARRLVLIKAVDKLPAREGEALVPYLKAPCDSTILVLVAGKLDGRTKFGQAVAKHAVAVDCSRPPAGQLPAWIKEEARAVGVQLTEDAVHLLTELAGDSLALARRELEKLAAYVPPGRLAGPEDVEALRGGEPGASVFDLSSAIAAGARAQALRILARNFEAGEAPVRILGSLVWQYRQIWKVQDLLRSGCSEAQAARALGLSPYRLAGFAALARRLSEAHLRQAFALFPQTDSQLKGGSGGRPEIVLESLVLALCAAVDATRPTRETRPGPAAGAGAPRTVTPVRTWRTPGR